MLTLRLIRRWPLVLLFSLSGVGLFGVQSVQCYLLPAKQIVEFVVGRTSKVYNFRLDAIVESRNPDLPEQILRRRVIYYAARPNLLRQETADDPEGSIILVGMGRRLSLIDGHLLNEEARHEEIFAIPLIMGSSASLQAFLFAEQIDMNQVHLGRMAGQIAYVIGAPPRESEAPQFWCDKDRFWPLRILGKRLREGVPDLVDIRFLTYREVAEGIWMPSLIEFYRKSQLSMRFVVQEVAINKRLPGALFDMQAFAAEYPPLPPPEKPSKEPVENLEEMRRYLEKKYE